MKWKFSNQNFLRSEIENASKQAIEQFKKAALPILLFAGFFIYIYGYTKPAKIGWDETYHIPSAEKYLQRTFFMEPHPPLGKLLIAAGEKMLHPNEDANKTVFVKKFRVKEFPEGISFAGYRFFSVFTAWINIALFFILLKNITNNETISFFGTFLYLFDNATILQSRNALLEPFQIFFLLLALILFVKRLGKPKKVFDYFLMGSLVGLAASVKLNGLILSILPLGWIVLDGRPKEIPKTVFSFIGFAATFLGIFYIHFALASNVDHDLLKTEKYPLSRQYKIALEKHETWNPAYFPYMLKDYFKYVKAFEEKAPPYKPNDEGECGSPPYWWPIGEKAIPYRCEKLGSVYMASELRPNKTIWLFSLAGLLTAVFMLFSSYAKRNRKMEKEIKIAATAFTLYIGYMATMMLIPRVMYLYHYLIPLMFAHVAAIAAFYVLYKKANSAAKVAALSIFSVAIVFTWLKNVDVTYYIQKDRNGTAEFCRKTFNEADASIRDEARIF